VGTTRAQLVALDRPDEAVAAPVLEVSPGTAVPMPALDLPRARRPGWATLAALAAGCGVAATLLGAWVLVATMRDDEGASPGPTLAQAVAVLTDSHAERAPLRGSLGRITLVVGTGDRAVLALDGLGPAPAGRAYAAWLVLAGSATPHLAATFSGAERSVLLEQPVPHGARVGVTLESASPPDRPSRSIRISAVRG
jgi:Anti-sigma-K factor rskA, C-terminal